MKNNGIKYAYVLASLTRKEQPLDISVNGPFKLYCKNVILLILLIILRI